MAKKQRKRRRGSKKKFPKLLRQATHPIPHERVEKEKKKYDRKKEKERLREKEGNKLEEE